MNNIVFNSTDFPVIPHEDDELNPGILGRSVADWIKEILRGTRFEITEDINEDFGYCLMVHRRPYWLWVGCSGFSDYDYPENELTKEIAESFPLESIEWNIWVTSERGYISKLLNKDNRKSDIRELHALLKDKLANKKQVRFK
jgi:hypothetical protein